MIIRHCCIISPSIQDLILIFFWWHCCLQLFQERLSEIAHATIPKGIMGSFKFTVPWLQHFREIWENDSSKKSNKSRFDSYSIRNVPCWSYPRLPFGIVACAFFRQPFSKQLYIILFTQDWLNDCNKYWNVLLHLIGHGCGLEIWVWQVWVCSVCWN